MFGRWLEAQSLSREYVAKLSLIEQRHPTAEHQKKSECCRSGVCCWRRPGAMTPDDLRRLAARHQLSVTDFFEQFCVVDIIHDKVVVLPRRKHQQNIAGGFVPWRETYSVESPCVFLGDGNRCDVHEDKPAACAAFRCWDDDGNDHAHNWSAEELQAAGWSDGDPRDIDD